MQYLPTLRVFFGPGRYNDYRLRGGAVEFLPRDGGEWRKLDDSDLQLHRRFNTPVAKWLREHAMEREPHHSPTQAGKRRRSASASPVANENTVS